VDAPVLCHEEEDYRRERAWMLSLGDVEWEVP